MQKTPTENFAEKLGNLNMNKENSPKQFKTIDLSIDMDSPRIIGKPRINVESLRQDKR